MYLSVPVILFTFYELKDHYFVLCCGSIHGKWLPWWWCALKLAVVMDIIISMFACWTLKILNFCYTPNCYYRCTIYLL